MKKAIRKIGSVLGTVAMVSATMAGAVATSYPAPFVSNGMADVAIVYGADADLSDVVGSATISSNLAAELASQASSSSVTTEGGVTEDEVVLGGVINLTGSKIEATMTDAKIPSLIDQKISWDDGNGADDYDVHEAVLINGDMSVITSLSDEDLEGVALTNNMALEYRYIFDDALNTTGIGGDDADTLYLSLLGKQYEIEAIGASSITVVTSEEVSLAIGESVTVDGKTFTVDDVFDGKAQVNGEIISEGSTKKIDGVQVRVDTVGYHSNAPELSKVIVKVGDDITKVYNDGDEFIGEDEDDPLWTWTISTPTVDGGYIGVSYNVNINDADDSEAGDSIKYVGDSYVLPDNFAEVKLVGTTDVDYESITVEFDTVDLYNESDSASAMEDKEVIVISAATTSSIAVGGEETDKIYIYWASNTSLQGAAAAGGAIETYYRDHDGDFTPTNKARYETQDATLTNAAIATIEVGDTNVDVIMNIASGDASLIFAAGQENVTLNVSGTQISATAGTFEQLGGTLEDADVNDIIIGSTDVSTKEESIMTNYGIIVSEDDSKGVEGNADADKVILSVPDEQVYAIVSVLGMGGSTSSETTELGAVTVTDAEVADVAGKNLVVVGGSAINSVAAELLGGALSESAFTDATGVAAGEFLIESFSRNSKVALLVAGYNAEDTTKAITYLTNNAVDTTVGAKLKGTSATEATVVTA